MLRDLNKYSFEIKLGTSNTNIDLDDPIKLFSYKTVRDFIWNNVGIC